MDTSCPNGHMSSDTALFCPTCGKEKDKNQTQEQEGGVSGKAATVIMVIIIIVMVGLLAGAWYMNYRDMCENQQQNVNASNQSSQTTSETDNNSGLTVSSKAPIIGFYQFEGQTLVLHDDHVGVVTGVNLGNGTQFHWEDKGDYYDVTNWNNPGVDGAKAKIDKVANDELQMWYYMSGQRCGDTFYKVPL